MGPVGSGKSVACCWALWMKAHTQEPNENGIRYTRWVIIRNTIPRAGRYNLKDLVILRACAGGFGNVSMTRPMSCPCRWYSRQHGGVGHWIPKDGQEAIILITGGWITEVKEMPKSVFHHHTDTQQPGRSYLDLP